MIHKRNWMNTSTLTIFHMQSIPRDIKQMAKLVQLYYNSDQVKAYSRHCEWIIQHIRNVCAKLDAKVTIEPSIIYPLIGKIICIPMSTRDSETLLLQNLYRELLCHLTSENIVSTWLLAWGILADPIANNHSSVSYKMELFRNAFNHEWVPALRLGHYFYK